VLIVDDNPVVLLGQAGLFRAAGFTVIEANSGAEAVRLARQHHPDLTLLDVMLPDGDGVELCRQLKSDPSLAHPFVVLVSSSQVASERQAAGLEAGADGYIARPIEGRELVARVQALIRIQQAEAALRRAHDVLEARVQERTAELAAANEALRTLSLRLVDLQEAERRSVARELHDEAGQWLTGLKLVLDQALPIAPAALQPRLEEAVGLTRELVERMRRISHGLRPALLDDLGLTAALESLFQRHTRQSGISVDFRQAPLPGRLAPRLETALYRIAQEALTNATRHAGVSSVIVRLWADAERAGLQIEDEGRGFDPEAALAAGVSNGLAGMRERATLLGGELTVDSAPGRGTRITVELPCGNAAEPARDRTARDRTAIDGNDVGALSEETTGNGGTSGTGEERGRKGTS
jgi:signal transduction histidine kinase